MQLKRGKSLVVYGAIIFVLFFCWQVYGSTPSNVRVTNVRGTQFTVSWTSPSAEKGQLKYGISVGNHATWAIKNDDRGLATTDDIHHVTLTGLTPSTTYYYEIISGSTTDNNGGNFYNLNTGPALTPAGSCLPAGKVFKDQAKSQFAYDSIVYVTILGATVDKNSAPESVLVTTTSNGYWFVDLVNFRTKDYSAPYVFACGTSQILVEAQGGNDGTASMSTKAIEFSTAERPDLILTGEFAQDTLLTYNVPILKYPYYAKIVHDGAVQLCPFNPNMGIIDSTGVSCPYLISTDTYLTIVNPAEPFPIPCSASVTAVPPATWYFTVTGYVVLYDSYGKFIGTIYFKVKPRGNYTVSLARILLLSRYAKDYADCRLRKFTYEIIWNRPFLTDYLEKTVKCVIRPPIIPISVEVKEIMYNRWYCYETIRSVEEDQDLLINRSDIVKTWSETILDKSNMIFPLYYIAEEKPVLDAPTDAVPLQ